MGQHATMVPLVLPPQGETGGLLDVARREHPLLGFTGHGSSTAGLEIFAKPGVSESRLTVIMRIIQRCRAVIGHRVYTVIR